MEQLRDLIVRSEDWLVHRVLRYARERDYVKYTSTLAEAWRASIAGLSEALLHGLERYPHPPELTPDEDYSGDPIARFGVLEAQRHRARGVSLAMFLGLMKYYRQGYVDLVLESGLPPEVERRSRAFVDRFFDRVELGFTTEWSSLGQADEVAELQEANRRITNEKNKYLTIFESMKDPVLLLDVNGSVVNMNFAASELFGVEGTPGSLYYRDRGPSLPDDICREIAGLLENGDTDRQFPATLHTASGLCEFEVRIERMLDVSEKFAGTVVLLHDVTEWNRVQSEVLSARVAAEAASRAKSQFLANMGHELRTPMSSLLGMIQLVLTAEPNEEQRRFLEMAHQSGKSLLAIIDDVLDLSRIESGTLKFERVAFDPTAVVEISTREFAQAAQEKGLELVLQVARGMPSAVLGDPGKLRQVLVNLVGNAIKFTASGDVVVRAACEDRPPDGSPCRLGFEVSDTGIGFPPEASDRLLQGFTQPDGSSMRRHGGAGLGLSICKRLVEGMGGRITGEGLPGRGSVFRFSCPFEVPPEGGEPEEKARRGSVAGMRVLVVADSAAALRALGDMLEEEEATAVLRGPGERGAEALEVLSGSPEPFHAILLDGPALASGAGARLSEMVAAGAELPPIFSLMTFGDLMGSGFEGSEKYLSGKLLKPITRNELLDALAPAQDRRRTAGRNDPPAFG